MDWAEAVGVLNVYMGQVASFYDGFLRATKETLECADQIIFFHEADRKVKAADALYSMREDGTWLYEGPLE